VRDIIEDITCGPTKLRVQASAIEALHGAAEAMLVNEFELAFIPNFLLFPFYSKFYNFTLEPLLTCFASTVINMAALHKDMYLVQNMRRGITGHKYPRGRYIKSHL
jgi:hypothetical protein